MRYQDTNFRSIDTIALHVCDDGDDDYCIFKGFHDLVSLLCINSHSWMTSQCSIGKLWGTSQRCSRDILMKSLFSREGKSLPQTLEYRVNTINA